MNELLPRLYDQIEPAAFRIAERAVELEPADAQRAYLVRTSQEILSLGNYRRTPPSDRALASELSATLEWFAILERELDDYVSGSSSPSDLVNQGGGRLWAAFQADEPICGGWADGVAEAVAPRVAGRRVLELGAGTGGTTRRLASALKECAAFVVSDIRQTFVDRIAAGLSGVPVTTALVDINDPDPSIGSFDLVYATNCLHVAVDVEDSLRRLHALLSPGGMLVLGEGAHYSETTPSPLSLVLSLFDGWWDAPTDWARPRPGFLQPEPWLAALAKAGYEAPVAKTWRDAHREFGGVYFAHRARAG